MANVRTVDFLPEIFQTPVNKQFLAATLDQLVQNPEFEASQGFVGRKVGPGVNPGDQYVIEPTASRTDYQLEPGVVELDPSDSNTIIDAITYPGINDALAVQGANVVRADRLYTSDYYAFDPFVDYDKFSNFAQYFWLPSGPLAVDVSATVIPTTADYTVTRANGAYTFSSYTTNNPALTLVRGGSYNFIVSQNDKTDVTLRVTNRGTSSYVINYEVNPTLELVRGNTYTFDLSLTGTHPLWIKTVLSLGDINPYNTGVTNNGATIGAITFTVPQTAPDTLYYCSSLDVNMQGTINVVNATPGTGPGFWIQTDPGVNGLIPATPNISSRDVLGVVNNGEDLGTVTFNVPVKTAQDFYYNLPSIGTVDLVTNLDFDQVDGQYVISFTEQYGGIDGISNLNGRTVVFSEQPATDVWRITYVADGSGDFYMTLTSVMPVTNLQKFVVSFGTQWASTQWYSNAFGFFQEMPLLTAARDVLFYQDGTDPNIFAPIYLIDQSLDTTLDIANIIGHKTYTSPNGVVFTNGLKVTFRGQVTPASYQNKTYYVEGVGTAIKLLPVTNYVTPEQYTQSLSVPFDSVPYDDGNFDATLNAPLVPDYITINRGSPDLNAWSRSNRWFHIDVINAAAAYNKTTPTFDNAQRAKRPIIEFRGGIRLYDFGTAGKAPINIIDLTQTDAFSNVAGKTGYSIDGYPLADGSRVVFAADEDINVRNKIWVVTFVTPDTVPPLIAQPIITLNVADDGNVNFDNTVVVLDGLSLQGTSWFFDGVAWLPGQEKTSANQPPLFNVYDSNGVSFGDRVSYPSSTFRGSKLFGYLPGTGSPDTVLGFAITYLTLTNIGDIIFDNFLYTDTFNYTVNSIGQTLNVSEGFVREYADRTTFVKEIGWQNAIVKSRQRQQFQFTYNGLPLQLDVPVIADQTVPPLQIYISGAYIEPNAYTWTTTSTTTTITLTGTYTLGSIIEVNALSDVASPSAFYQIPVNLENNPFNVNSSTLTLGTIRNHYNTICENLIAIQGPINGANNSRDLGNLVPYGQQILQESAPLTLAGYFMRNPEYNIFAALNFNSREYIRYKSRLLNAVADMDVGTMTVPEILDAAIASITAGATPLSPFYWSDMLPSGAGYTELSYTTTFITTNVFNLTQTYDFTKSNYLGLLVYLNDVILVRDVEYVVSTDAPKVTILVPLEPGDVVTIREYPDTAGSFCPNTPTKLGLYSKFIPRQFVDTNYVNPTAVIQGHDGSITVAFNDIRDQVLLEFEKRIYDNLKNDDNPVPLTIEEVMPGFFRETDYSVSEINALFAESFLSWVGWNKIDYQAQDYIVNNPFTYNYSQAGDKITEKPLPGAWRGIYRYFYDTTSPNTTPWEMLGISEKPLWWEERYGPAPYTADNLVLWDDLEAGYIADPLDPRVDPLYVRPGLTAVIPVDGLGQLVPPLDSVVGNYNPLAWQRSWGPNDGGPAEASWWASSNYPFAVMRVLALTRPAQFFTLFADRDLYRYDFDIEQYLYNGRYRLNASGIQVYGNGVSKASYIDWIVDYNQQTGRDSTTALTTDLANLDVRLCYRMAAFTSKQYINLFAETAAPDSNNSTLQIPDDSYVLLPSYKNQPFNTINYSGLIIEALETGYAVFGYNNAEPYFQVLASSTSGPTEVITAGGATVQVPKTYTQNIVQIPYGYQFINKTIVVDFILSYGAFLETQGMTFTEVENGYTLNWRQMAQEFLYWSNQGWGAGTMINLNPVASQLTITQPLSVVDTIESITPENMLLDQNRAVLPTRNLIIERMDNTLRIQSATRQTISYLNLHFTNYETMIILNNRTVFNDLIYDPATAARQNRIRFAGYLSTEWDGELNAQGFILNDPRTVVQWSPNVKYTKGEIVIYKNNYWSALTIVQPSATFNYSDWVKSQYAMVDRGFLENIATKADQLALSYDVNYKNLDPDQNLLSFGLIGYRPRQYMQNLGLDSVSQVNLYKQFLGIKGTRLAAEQFTFADLGKETGQYAIYENWGILAGTYGATANKRFFEVLLNESLLRSNPSTVQIINPGQASAADQTVYVSNIWQESYPITSPDILPTIYDAPFDTALPTAGYVNLEDADIKVFSLSDPSAIEADISNVGIGTIIWVAQDNPYTWNIYRCAKVPGTIFQLQDNLNGTSTANFTAPHNLTKGATVIIRYFNQAVNGVYRVLSVPTPSTITIAFAFTNTDQTSIAGQGLAFFLQTCRVAQASDVANLAYVNALVPGARAWVDDDGTGKWEVLEKTEPFAGYTTLIPPTGDLNPGSLTTNNYGYSVAQAYNHIAALVGAPGINGEAGTVYTYKRIVRGNNINYEYNVPLLLTATDTVGYGDSLSFGESSWGVAGASQSNSGAGYATTIYKAPDSNNIGITALLVAPDSDYSAIGFGQSVAISLDERWMYIGAPAGNKVYAYGRVDVPAQQVVYIADGVTSTFNYADSIQINSTYPDQLIVTIDNLTLEYSVDYGINATNVNFYGIPVVGQRIVIRRRMATQLDAVVYYDVVQNGTSGVGYGATFTVNSVRGTYFPTLVSGGSSYAVGNTLVISYTQICPAGSNTNNLIITVTGVSGGAITAFTYTGSGISNTTVFSLQPTLYTATVLSSFSVEVAGDIYRPNIDYTFNAGTLQITFITVPSAGAIIAVEAGTYWKYLSTVTTSGLSSDAEFGASIATTTDGRQLIVGAPQDTVDALTHAGSVYVFDRSVVQYIVDNASQTTYTIPSPYTQPVAVLHNGAFLTNAAYYVDGQFTISGSSVILNSNVTLTVGDSIEIETNQFAELQSIVADEPVAGGDFGRCVTICNTNCSIYIGSPLAPTAAIPQTGLVQRNINQSRLYGVTTSTIANPTLTAGDTIRVDDVEVVVPNAPNNTLEGLVASFSSSVLPNVQAAVTPNLTFIGDGVTQIYNVGPIYATASSYTAVVYVDDVLQIENTDYTYNNTAQTISFVTAPAPLSDIVVVSGRITISLINPAASEVRNKVTVLPGITGTAFYDLGFTTYPYAQTIVSPSPVAHAQFGYSLDVNSTSVNLVVGAPTGNVYEPMTFDGGKTYFDEHSTTFYSPIINCGVAYTYDFLPSANPSVASPGAFVFGQQIYSTTLEEGYLFGWAVNYTSSRLMVGAPGNDLNNNVAYDGRVDVFDNVNDVPSWKVIHKQLPTVDVRLINGVFTYDKTLSKIQTYLDYINPLQGKILGAARSNLDFIGSVDPANYNQGSIHNLGNSWESEYVGQMWWDTTTTRFIDPNQDDILYASSRWSQLFPGSRVDIYQWTASSVTPDKYTGPGTPLSITSYTIGTYLDSNNVLNTQYYFWVRGITTIATTAGKTLSPSGVASYIANPRNSGIPYIAPLNASTFAIYNSLNLLSAQNTAIHIGFDQTLNDDDIHTEYQFITEGKADSFLSDTLYRKLQDSFCGVDTFGNQVPDPRLSPAMRYGVQFRPRQSMFADRFTALENYLTHVNRILLQYPIVEMRSFTLLNASEPIPVSGSGAWDYEVANLTILGYQDIQAVPLGYKYLVLNDSSQDGRWTIYEVESGLVIGSRELTLVRVQSYDTPLYWNTTTWYLAGYNTASPILTQVNYYADLATIPLTRVPIGGTVKVLLNAQGNYELYQRTGLDPATGWTRVALQNGTIQFSNVLWNYPAGNFGFDANVFDSQYFDQEPVVETRYIIQAINEQLFTDELLIFRNESLMLMFDLIYAEFAAPEWLIKTSYVDITHNIRALLPYPTYLEDNQTFVLDYINEVKPYHVQTREFNLIYSGEDIYYGDVTDFDVPAYYDINLERPQFVSPILTPYTHAPTVFQSNASDADPDTAVWTVQPWIEWFQNYTLEVSGVDMITGGVGYTIAPQVEVTGDCTTPAVLTAIINSAGQVVSVSILDPGTGYIVTPTITFIGGNGSGAQAAAVMVNNLVRSFTTTIKYDRCEYFTTIPDWDPALQYPNGTQVRYANIVWSANSTTGVVLPSTSFNPSEWLRVDAGSLSGANRTMGFYNPSVNEPGRSLPLLIDGVSYPGVQVTGLPFNFGPGFDVAPFDTQPFDNISYGPDGTITYDKGVLDAIYESSYLDIYLGTRPTDINVDGGAYIDTFSSYAPEELVPGSEFDTMDFRVYTTPGGDWEGLGHGFPVNHESFVYLGTSTTYPFSDTATAFLYPVGITVVNKTTKVVLTEGVNYTVNWSDLTFTVTSGANLGNVISSITYELGGGNQLYKQFYTGSDITDPLIVPVQYPLIQEFAIFLNGTPLTVGTDYTYAQATAQTTAITFNGSFVSTDGITLVAIGPTTVGSTTVNYSWSAPQTQVITSTGVSAYYVANSLAYTNPDVLIVNVNGVRQRTSAGITQFGDSATVQFNMPSRLGFSLSTVADSDVYVYINNATLLTQGVDYVVDAFIDDEVPRTITFNTAPPLGQRILIAVRTGAQCFIVGNTIEFVQPPIVGSAITITTFNDTREQNLLTQVVVGPETRGITVYEGYDLLPFDQAVVNDTSGSFDYSVGVLVTVNNIILDQYVADPGRLWVTLNGRVLSNNTDYTIVEHTTYTSEGYDEAPFDEADVPDTPGSFSYTIKTVDQELVLSSGILRPTDIVMINYVTNAVVPEAMAFRIFQDMRGVQATYRITPQTTTTLTQVLLKTDDVIHVADAAALGQPDVDNNIWGVLTVNGERIMYRERDTTANTVSSLLRGTAGTAAADHLSGSLVYDMGRTNLLPAQYQNYIVSGSTLADGNTRVFSAADINLTFADAEGYSYLPFDIGLTDGEPGSYDYGLGDPYAALEVYVGGIRVPNTAYVITDLGPATVQLSFAPPEGVEVTLLVRRGISWYNPGITTASDGVPLQDTNNPIARFLRGGA